MGRRYTEEDIKRLQEEVNKIRDNGEIGHIMENTQELSFSSPKETSEYFNSRPLEEFEREFRGGN